MDLDENNRIKTDNLYNICLKSVDKKRFNLRSLQTDVWLSVGCG